MTISTHRAIKTSLKVAFIAGLATTAFSAAQAADLRGKGPVYKAPVATIYNWTGFYVGVNAGLGVSSNRSALAVPATPSAETFMLGAQGGLVGLQAGYNWQSGNWVIGAETDIQWSGQRNGNTCINACIGGAFGVIDTALTWFGTTRARVGYANGSVLNYYTGGVAYGGVRTTITEAVGGPAGAITFSNSRTGWTLGSGVEASLGGNWTGKIEYLYVNLGKTSAAFTLSGNANTFSTEHRNHIFRAGLNYQFGKAGSMLAAAPASDWRGLYVGANVGSSLGFNDTRLTAVAASNERFLLSPRGFLGGAQVGYNWQAANAVFGVEADFQGSTSKDNQTCVIGCFAATPSIGTIEQKTPWLGTLRGRVGYASGSALFYLTGGLAYGNVKTTITETIPTGAGIITVDAKRTGYVIGGGVERATNFFGLLGPGWTAKSEYLYVDLGAHAVNYTLGGVAHTFSTDTHQHIFRSGLNYHFNQPIVAKF